MRRIEGRSIGMGKAKNDVFPGNGDQVEWAILGRGQRDASSRGSMSWCRETKNGLSNRIRGS